MSTNEMIGLIVVSLGSIIGTGAMVVKPLINNVKVMTELNESIKNLAEKFNAFEVNNHDDHKRIWTHNDRQDLTIQEHETRISVLEKMTGDN